MDNSIITSLTDSTFVTDGSLFSIAVGLGLAAACGFRIFIPFLLIGSAHRLGYLGLAEGFEWMSSTPAMLAFGTATVLEVAAYFIPFVDNVLDAIATPSAVVAGIVVSASQVSDMDAWLGWALAVIGGGGIAGAVQGVTAFTRQVSSLATAGFANPLVSTAEAFGSVVMALLAVFMPLVGLGLLLVLLYFGLRRLRFRERPPATA